MLSSRAQKALTDIQDNILLAQAWSDGMSLKAFEEDRKAYYAVTRCLEIISEASRRLPPEMFMRHDEYPWRAMRDAGSIYRHHYEGVEEALVLQSVQEHLPPLLAIIEQELAAAGG